MRLSIATLSFALVGCASGTILGASPASHIGASLLVAPEGGVREIRPLHSTGEWTKYNAGLNGLLWVSGGWYIVSFACDVLPTNGSDGKLAKVLLREHDTVRNIRVKPGRRYELYCSPDALGALRIKDTGAAPNQPLHPNALTRAGERRR